MRLSCLRALAVCFVLLPSRSLAGDLPPAAGASAGCPATSLLAGLRPTHSRQVEGDVARLTDGQVAPEGGIWNSALAVRMPAAATFVTFDLGGERTLRSLLVQADANDSYLVEGSLDGILFAPVGLVPRLADLHGLRSRALPTAPSPVRFLRVSSSSDDGRASISEIQAFCVLPGAWDPRLQVVDTPAAQEPERDGRWWNDHSSRWWELTLAFLGLALLAWDASRRQKRTDSDTGRSGPGGTTGAEELQSSPPARRWKRRNGIFAAFGLVAAFTSGPSFMAGTPFTTIWERSTFASWRMTGSTTAQRSPMPRAR